MHPCMHPSIHQQHPHSILHPRRRRIPSPPIISINLLPIIRHSRTSIHIHSRRRRSSNPPDTTPTSRAGPTPTPTRSHIALSRGNIDFLAHNHIAAGAVASSSPSLLAALAQGRGFEDNVPRVHDAGDPAEEAKEDVEEDVAAAASSDDDGEGWEDEGDDA